jgi:hypothetical protein
MGRNFGSPRNRAVEVIASKVTLLPIGAIVMNASIFAPIKWPATAMPVGATDVSS